jgi:hypothetical protein
MRPQGPQLGFPDHPPPLPVIPGERLAGELSQMKGQMVAVEQASIVKKCNIQFHDKPPAT